MCLRPDTEKGKKVISEGVFSASRSFSLPGRKDPPVRKKTGLQKVFV